MANYTEVLTEQEINRIVASLPEGSNAEDVLSLMAWYAECSLVFNAVISGEMEVDGINENGLKFRTSKKALKRLH